MKIFKHIRRLFHRTLTPEQLRLKVYYLMLEKIRTDIWFGGLCHCLEYAAHSLYRSRGIDVSTWINEYPELIRHKPEESLLHSHCWWFAPHLVEPRTKILTEAINELEFKLSNTKVSEETDI